MAAAWCKCSMHVPVCWLSWLYVSIWLSVSPTSKPGWLRKGRCTLSKTLLLDMLRIEVRVPVLLRASKAAHAGLHSLLCHHKPLHCQFSSACKGTTTEGFTHLEDPIHHLRLVQCSQGQPYAAQEPPLTLRQHIAFSQLLSPW